MLTLVKRKTAPPFGQPVPTLKPTTTSIARTPNSKVQDELPEFVDHLIRDVASRPKRKKALLSYLNSHFDSKLSETEQLTKLKEIEKRTRLKIDAKGAVTYPA